LDGSGGTGNTFLTQTLPTSEDGKVYVEVGTMHNTYDTWRLHVDHPIYEYKDGKLRLYLPQHYQAVLNGTASTYPSFFAPTTNGTTGYLLKASTSGAPN
jgi:hypothetical protein